MCSEAKCIDSANAEIFLLTQKSYILEKRCTEQINESKEKHLKLQYDFNQQQEQYINRIETMEEQTKNQQMKLESLQHELNNNKSSLEAEIQQHQTTINNLKNKNDQQAQQLSLLSDSHKELKTQIVCKDQTISTLRRTNFELEKNKLMGGNTPILMSDSTKSVVRMKQYTPIPKDLNRPLSPSEFPGTDLHLFIESHSNVTDTSEKSDNTQSAMESMMQNFSDVHIGTIDEQQESTPTQHQSNLNSVDGFQYSQTLSYQSTDPEEPSVQDALDADPYVVLRKIKKEYEEKYQLKIMELHKVIEALKATIIEQGIPMVVDNDTNSSLYV